MDTAGAVSAGAAGAAGTEVTPDRRRWAVLAAGVVAIAVGCLYQFGLPYLIPHLRAEGMSLAQAGLLSACPSFGLMSTLVIWGAVADRWGERLVLAAGLAAAAPCLAAAALLAPRGSAATVPVAACLILAGAAGASVHAASGRLILGWFAQRRRGLAMGIRQTAQPIGVGTAALVLPVLAGHGSGTAFAVLAGACMGAVGLVVAVVRDPPRPRRAAGTASSPYRTPVLWRIHAASALLVLPQFTVAAFGLTYLVDAHGWTPVDGGRLLALAQVGGAAARLTAGWWSDRVASRTGPLRLVSLVIAVTLAALATATATGSASAVALLVAASIVTVSPNGLAYTAVAEYAGGSWAGRALGIQNTGQNAVAALTPPLVAILVATRGYAPAFLVAGALPVLAAALVPHPLPRPPASAPAEPPDGAPPTAG
jgi:sugar phosphate permease